MAFIKQRTSTHIISLIKNPLCANSISDRVECGNNYFCFPIESTSITLLIFASTQVSPLNSHSVLVIISILVLSTSVKSTKTNMLVQIQPGLID